MAEKIKLYRPTSCAEGEIFKSAFCYECSKWRDDPDAKTQCMIALESMIYDIGEPQYPNQWRYIDGKPTCTAFDSREERNAKRRQERSPAGRCKSTIDMFSEIPQQEESGS